MPDPEVLSPPRTWRDVAFEYGSALASGLILWWVKLETGEGLVDLLFRLLPDLLKTG